MKDRAIERQGPPVRHGGPRRDVSVPMAVLLGGLGLAGCSLSVPMGSAPDEMATGTIKASSPSPFSAEMDAEDWRRAKSALDTALDPQGNGTSVAWENPASGARGSFVPVAQVYPKGDGICRPFTARVSLRGRADKVLQASACRVNSGQWVVGQVADAPSPAVKAPGKAILSSATRAPT